MLSKAELKNLMNLAMTSYASHTVDEQHSSRRAEPLTNKYKCQALLTIFHMTYEFEFPFMQA